ncbi:titin-like isoform X3 [Leptopilina heterotoma]|uniref:titin-like isoform X3 n=1 Tax=Leptopilina heterotoma TaxID=63436 RepID=UPI001CA83DC3|nr:titin-like isoform X3 [Leptopilina heterotoma]
MRRITSFTAPAKIVKQNGISHSKSEIKKEATIDDLIKKPIDEFFDFEIGYDAINIRFLDINNFIPDKRYEASLLTENNIQHYWNIYNDNNKMSHVIYGLKPGEKITFKLSIKENFNDLVVKEKKITTIFPEMKPSRPEGPLIVVNKTDTTCEIMWKKSNSDNKYLEKYYISDGQNKYPMYSARNEIRDTITGLIPGSDNTISVYAENNIGKSEPISVNCHTNSES